MSREVETEVGSGEVSRDRFRWSQDDHKEVRTGSPVDVVSPPYSDAVEEDGRAKLLTSKETDRVLEVLDPGP